MAVAVVPELLLPGPCPRGASPSPHYHRQVWVEAVSWGRKNGGVFPAGMTVGSFETLFTNFFMGVCLTTLMGDLSLTPSAGQAL